MISNRGQAFLTILQAQILQTDGNFFQNIEKQARKRPESKQEYIFWLKYPSKNKVLLFGKYVPAFVDVLGPTSASRNFPVKNISWFRQKTKAIVF